MEIYTSPPHQQKLKNLSVRTFGYDTSGQIDYTFNSIGFRSPEIANARSLFVIGNSVSFGIGLPMTDTFAYQVSDAMTLPLANLSYGCHFHENHDHLHNIHSVAQRDHDDIILLQINNLDRFRKDRDTVVSGNDQEFCVKRFLDYFCQVKNLFRHKSLMIIYWDEIHYDMPKTIKDNILHLSI